MSEIKVLHLVRAVGPTSMPWNDLYGTTRGLTPGLAYPPVAVGWNRTATNWALCAGRQRRYLRTWPFGALQHILRLGRLAQRRGRTLIIHNHNPILAAVLLCVKIANPSAKIVTTQHNEWRFFRLHQRLGLRVLAQLSDHYVCCGRAVAETLPLKIRKRLVGTNRLSAVPNGINPRQLREYTHERDQGPVSGPTRRREPITAVVVARMVPQKNCMFVLRLLKEAKSIDRLIWFGDGPERAELTAEINRLQLGSRVELRGRRPRGEVLTTLSQASLYIAASKWEGLSVADLEATALGCWPIMSDIAQRREIADALDIPLYPLSDMDGWIQGIDAFLRTSPEKQREMRQRIATRTQSNFDLTVTVARYLEIYKKVSSDQTALELAGQRS